MKIKEEVIIVEQGSVSILEDMLQDIVRDTVSEMLDLTINRETGRYYVPNPHNIEITIKVLDEDD